MARKTVSLQKRSRRKKTVAQTSGKPKRIKNNRLEKETKMDEADHVDVDASSADTNVKEEAQQQHDTHKDGDACNCFLRRGQMFLPPSMQEANHDNA
eukprot:scaffold187_cov266-Chaetoceros_neogracile.AAC.81